MFDHLSKTSEVSVEYFVFSGSTLRYLDRQSTETGRYFTSQLYFEGSSTNARSTDQEIFFSVVNNYFKT